MNPKELLISLVNEQPGLYTPLNLIKKLKECYTESGFDDMTIGDAGLIFNEAVESGEIVVQGKKISSGLYRKGCIIESCYPK